MFPNLYLNKLIISIIFISLLILTTFTLCKKKQNLINKNFLWDDENIRIERSILESPKSKWELPINFTIKENLDENEILSAIEGIENQTCIRFNRVNEITGVGIQYINGPHCKSIVGKSKKTPIQNITIGPDCDWKGGIQHETAHALGLLHEMSRKDRDKYIKILEENLDPESHVNFKIFDKLNLLTYGINFNYGSCMLYNRFAGSKNDKPAVKAILPYYSKTMGQLNHLAFTDVKLLNMHYCSNICQKNLKCQNNGYTNPNNCSICLCPRFFEGTLCEKMWYSPPTCGKKILKSKSKLQTLKIAGIKKCLYKIVSPKKNKISLEIKYAKLVNEINCNPNKGVEIKYLIDKSVSGAVLCGHYKNAVIKSSGNIIYIFYVGLNKSHKFIMNYKTI